MLVRQTLFYLPAQIVGPLSQVVAALLWTHWLAPGPYGLLTFLVAGQDLVFLVCLSWWTHYTMRYSGGLAGQDRADFHASEAPVFALAFVVQVVATVAVLGLLREPVGLDLVAAAIAYVGTRTLLHHLGERARTQGRIAAYTIGQLGGSGFGLVVAFAAVALVAPTPASALWGFALAQAVTLCVLWRLLGLTRGSPAPRPRILRAALAFGMPLVAAGGLAWLAQNGIRIVVEQLAGVAAMGLIAVGWGLGQRLAATLAMVVIAASFPLAVKSLQAGSRDAAYGHLITGGLLLLGLILPASLGLALLAKPLVVTFVGAPFRDTTIAILPYAAAAGAVRNIRMHIADPVFLLIERPRINTLINVIDVVAVLGCCLVGLLGFGLVGAVVGCLAGASVGAIAGFVLARRLGGFVFPVADGLRIAGAATLMAAVLLAVPWDALTPEPVIRMLVEATLGAAVYGAALAVLYPAIPRLAGRRLREARRRFGPVAAR